MKDLIQATLIANFYVANRLAGPGSIKLILREHGITIHDARYIANAIRRDISEIQDAQDEDNLMKQIQENGYTGLKHVEVLIGKQFIINNSNKTEQDILDNPIDAISSIDLVSKVAYKYELKYTMMIFDIMIDDEEIWETVVLH